MDRSQLKEAVQRFPQSPGVYLMKDANDRHLYIGKAVNLKKRVQSYFTDHHDDRFQIPYLLKKVALIEWIATNNETEALILEANLIKNHNPPYNLDLKDDKHFPYLKVTLNEPFPRLIVTRRVISDGAHYFGPFTEAGTMRRVMDFSHSIFKIRTCKRKLPLKNPVRPCINASIARCHGPCAGNISKQEYRTNVALLIQFLKGRRTDLLGELKQRMEKAAQDLDYETAASLRDQINLIRKSSRLQRVDMKTPRTDFDVFGIYESDRHTCLCVLLFRQGLLLSKRHFIFKRLLWDTPHTDHEAVILQFYQNALDDPPGQIILPSQKGFNKPLLASWFSRQYSGTIHVTIPQKGSKVELVRLAEKNARLYLSQKIPDDAAANLESLQSLLKLPRFPETIEAFDISNLGDTFAVAGMVRFTSGLPDKSLYRRYKIKTVTGQNDFAMLLEAVNRRLLRLHNEKKPFPDLFLIDGGKGQFTSAAKPLGAYTDPPMIIALAKKEETLFSPYTDSPVRLPSNHQVRKLVERIRDEVHRWVITYHRKVRDKQFHSSSLQALPGIGKKKTRVLLRHFGSVKRLRKATVEDITAVEGFSVLLAKKLFAQLHAGKKAPRR